MEIRILKHEDLSSVKAMDFLSGNHVATILLKKERGVYGAFLLGHLIAYCTIGHSADTEEILADFPDFPKTSLSLNDVFVHPAFRGNGYANLLIKKALENKQQTYILLNLLKKSLEKLYGKLGFISLCEYTLAKRV